MKETISEENIMKEMKKLEFMIKYIWPVYRLFIKSKISKRCNKCILSEKYTKITEGVCEECKKKSATNCKDNKKKIKQMRSDLKKIFNKTTKNKRLKYHAIVLFSGGKDSAYLLFKLKKDYPEMRLLALTIDNNFMSPIAMSNAKGIIKKLNVEHTVLRPPFEFSKKMYRYTITHLNKKGCSGTVDQFDGDLIHDMARNLAVSLSIPLVLSAISPIQVKKHVGISNFETSKNLEARKLANAR